MDEKFVYLLYVKEIVMKKYNLMREYMVCLIFVYIVL